MGFEKANRRAGGLRSPASQGPLDGGACSISAWSSVALCYLLATEDRTHVPSPLDVNTNSHFARLPETDESEAGILSTDPTRYAL